VRVEGRVQGVGYRAWVVDAAGSLSLDGWVRNRRDGAVEAVFGGVSDQVADMLKRCERGPSLARVTQVVIVDEGLSVDPGFTVRPTI
jgi:acylphosphatase